jgi:hypothetical protein
LAIAQFCPRVPGTKELPGATGDYDKEEIMDDLPGLIRGSWYNQLSSHLLLEADGSGRLSGSLRSGVGEAPNHFPLTGFFSPGLKAKGAVLSFVVSWTDVHSLTAWAGHYDPDENIITATWLLTGATDEWRSTNIGHDLFSRTSLRGGGQVPDAGSVPYV